MNYLKSIFIFSILFSVLSITAVAQQTEEDVRSMLEERDEEIKELVGPEGTTYTDEQRATLKEIINGVIDFEAMAQEALAETYDTIATEKREEFVDLFSTIVRDQSLNNLDIYRAKVTYTSIEVDGNQARVETLAQLENVRTPVNYELRFEEGQWFITDMEIDDVSTAASYNRQFQRTIAQNGFEDLMERLRKRAARA
ncbi:MlaC/ttg2D family ABC transporter substrate-binding protein [Gracilimonas mengyeensis]|uniref:Phospholipid transport system substrate-binding protein n=1 Tax=Gracilimonas mengyeensis TaxID=1302730 RepID=A0A521ABQ0_9BACT|nr:ABC transporter substrate-binding protein [Gracilimonas mengyeensis]SMO32225.1 phospholipid transport system substrate-binding protein [Gracilimonas mengyeensis]